MSGRFDGYIFDYGTCRVDGSPLTARAPSGAIDASSGAFRGSRRRKVEIAVGRITLHRPHQIFAKGLNIERPIEDQEETIERSTLCQKSSTIQARIGYPNRYRSPIAAGAEIKTRFNCERSHSLNPFMLQAK